MRASFIPFLFGLFALVAPRAGAVVTPDPLRFIQVSAQNQTERSQIANTGASIEAIRSDSVWAMATPEEIEAIKQAGFKILGNFDATMARGGHDSGFSAQVGATGFPAGDERFHDYKETEAALKSLQTTNADIARVSSIGKSLEGRDIWALNLNSSPQALTSGKSGKPGFILMGAHHAREHVSSEIALMFAQHLLDNRFDPVIEKLLETRDVWIIPIVNPDGKEWDIATGRYRTWRKNRRENGGGTYGVDLNRNYSYMWGTGGSSKNGASDTYMGLSPFSEPETAVIRDFVRSKTNAKTLLSLHTFSELILYPWGHKNGPVEKTQDRQVFEKMAKTMAAWNNYTPGPSSGLYIASGDTVDWAYGELGMFAFTFELSPKDQWSGGFYPGAKILDRVLADNIKPFLYMMEYSDDPYRVLSSSSSVLKHYALPSTPSPIR